MKIIGVRLFQFRIPFASPIQVGGMQLDKREGLLVAIEDDQGHVGWGETAPLPGLDTIQMEQCLEELRAAKNTLAGQPLDWNAFTISSPMMGLFPKMDTIHSLTAFGLESALLWLWVGRDKKHPWPKGDALSVPVNGLFVPSSDPKEFKKQSERLKARGFSAVKVKIGRLNPDEEVRQILELDSFFDHAITLRPDANQSLNPDQYQTYYEALKATNVEYVEEPLRPEFDFFEAAQVPWPLALDESLDKFAEQKDLLPKSLGAVILKPGSFDGIHGMARAMTSFHDQGIKTVLSSSFNSGIGVTNIAVLAALKGKETAHGLDTLYYFNQDVLAAPLIIDKGLLNIPMSLFTQKAPFQPGLLEEIS
ncbi:MAG: o-succinylbenzoate synthase [Desulfatibacillum sp.]|nr:o-succinylbenzoate synthase [Desulfatibacillum sp.]